MYIILVGSGPVGDGLLQMALQDGHDVAVIEAEQARAQQTLEAFDCTVIQADLAEGGILEEAKVDRADALIATTDDDAANLMAMFLGAEHGVKNLISVVNHARHQKLFERLGAHVLVDPERIIAQHLYGTLSQPKLQELVPLPHGAETFQVTVGLSSRLIRKTLSQAARESHIPQGMLIVSLRRAGQTLIPTGQTVLQSGDELTVFSQHKVSEPTWKIFTG